MDIIFLKTIGNLQFFNPPKIRLFQNCYPNVALLDKNVRVGYTV